MSAFSNQRWLSTADDIPFHPLSAAYPLLTGQELEEFERDVAACGIRVPIVLYEDQILDGRNRFLAAKKANLGVPAVEYLLANPTAAVFSLNDMRRHMPTGARALIAAEKANAIAGRNRARLHDNEIERVTAAQAGRVLGVSERTVKTAKPIVDAGSVALKQSVRSGDVPVHHAAEVAALPKDEQTEIVARGKKEIIETAKRLRAEKAKAKRDEKIARNVEIARQNKMLPAAKRRYAVIYADPAWPYDTWSDKGADRSPDNHYPTMTTDDILALPVGKIAADESTLFLWTVSPLLPVAFEAIKGWGFEYKTVAFVWVKTAKDGQKPATGMGYWTRSSVEICLLATRGSPPRLNADVRQVIMSPRREHSRKPDETMDRIERLVPGPYIELFARRHRENWAAWGNEV